MERFVPMVCCLSVALGCAASDDNPGTAGTEETTGTQPPSGTAGGAAQGSAGVATADASAGGTGGASGTGGKGGTAKGDAAANAGGSNAGGSNAGGADGSMPLPPATGTPGKWESVSPPGWAQYLSPPGDYGLGTIVADPARPTDMYVGGYGAIWKSTDYGLTWSMLNSKPNPPSLSLGRVLAVAGTSPATLWMANLLGDQKVFKSTDAGLTFRLTGTVPGGHTESLYSIIVDPKNSQHLLSGFHEADGLVESNDGGETWAYVSSGQGWPSGGKSWYPFFVDTQDGATPMKTWFVMAQGGSPAMTSDGGAHWATPPSIAKLEHSHGSCALYQNGKSLFIAGIYGPGDGVYRSTDLGATWSKVSSGVEAIVWGTPKNLYTMWMTGCPNCYKTAPQPGTMWTTGDTPVPGGAQSVAVTSDGTHSLFVGSMWGSGPGLWRYVEP